MKYFKFHNRFYLMKKERMLIKYLILSKNAFNKERVVLSIQSGDKAELVVYLPLILWKSSLKLFKLGILGHCTKHSNTLIQEDLI
jgi:hypothetical protein